MNILNSQFHHFHQEKFCIDYILGRAKKANIKKNIQFNTTVTQAKFNGNQFEVSTLNKKG